MTRCQKFGDDLFVISRDIAEKREVAKIVAPVSRGLNSAKILQIGVMLQQSRHGCGLTFLVACFASRRPAICRKYHPREIRRPILSS